MPLHSHTILSYLNSRSLYPFNVYNQDQNYCFPSAIITFPELLNSNVHFVENYQIKNVALKKYMGIPKVVRVSLTIMINRFSFRDLLDILSIEGL